MCLGQMLMLTPTCLMFTAADLPSVAALNTAIHPDEVLAAITALIRNKSSDLYGMRSEFIIDAASHLAIPDSAVFNNVFDTSFLPHSPLDASALFSRAEMSMIWTYAVASLWELFCLSCMLQC